jgi:hypothetical protein
VRRRATPREVGGLGPPLAVFGSCAEQCANGLHL